MLGKNHLGVADYLVVAATLLFSLFIGIFYAIKGRGSSNNEELLTGSRKMGTIPVAASMLVSYLSAISILGYPAEVYSYGLQLYLLTVLGPITYLIASYLFIEVLYKLKLTSAYNYLELRFNSVLVRWMGSGIFIVQLLLNNGIVLYAPAIALETIMGLPVWMSVVGIAVCGTIYTSIGGIKAVVWTDAFQFVMIFVGMVAIVLKGLSNAGGLSSAYHTATDWGRLDLFKWSVDPFERHNTLNMFLGNFANLYFIVHQPVVQRYCSLPTMGEAVKAVVWSSVLGLATQSLVVLTGVAIFAAYATCDPVTSGQIAKSDQIVPYFVVKELAFIPGMLGLFVAVVFSAVLSTISSTLNSLAAVTWEDFLVKIQFFKNLGDSGQTLTYKILTIVYSVMIVALAFYAENFGSIIQAAITVVSTTISIQGAVFLMGVFLPFVNRQGASVGMLAGMGLMGYFSAKAFLLQKEYSFQHKLNFSTDECSADILESYRNVSITESPTLLPASDLNFPERIFTLSYILYSLVGGVTTIVVGILISLLTGGRDQAKNVRPECLHKLVRPTTNSDAVLKNIQMTGSGKINNGFDDDKEN